MTFTEGQIAPSCDRVANDGDPQRSAATIRSLNDRLRVNGAGGLVLITDGVGSFEIETVNRMFTAVAAFDHFTADNDPYNEHDFGALTVEDVPISWKIDYYDRERRFLSPDPTDPKVTTRILTLMLASEY